MTAAKPADQRRNRNPHAPAARSTEPQIGPVADRSWSKATKDWWEGWRAGWLLDEVGWLQLRQIAHLLDHYWRQPMPSSMAEIRKGQEALRKVATDRAKAEGSPKAGGGAPAPVRRLRVVDAG